MESPSKPPGTTAPSSPTETPTDAPGASGGLPVSPAGVLLVIVSLSVVAAAIVGEPPEAEKEELKVNEREQPRVSGLVSQSVGRIRIGFGRLAGSASRATMEFVVGVSATAPRLFDATAVALREFSTGIALAGSGVPRPGRLLGGAGSALVGATKGLGAALSSLSVSRVRGGGRPGVAPRTDARDRAPEPEQATDDGPPSIDGAWEAMAASVPVEDRESRTPAELAREAVASGLPSGPVRRLTRTFREVAYGGRPRTRERHRRALEALRRLRQSREEKE